MYTAACEFTCVITCCTNLRCPHNLAHCNYKLGFLTSPKKGVWREKVKDNDSSYSYFSVTLLTATCKLQGVLLTGFIILIA